MTSKQELQELNEIWQEIIRSFQTSLSETAANLWFAPLNLESFDNNTIRFTTDAPFKYNIVRNRYMDLLKESFTEYLGFPVDVELIFTGTEKTVNEGDVVILETPDPVDPYAPEKPLERTVPKFREAVEVGSESFPHHFEYTFDNFIEGSSNRFARASCWSVANNPSFLENDPKYANKMRDPYNPLFIYGPSGIGKTHLLHAVINQIRSNFPNAKILYIKGDDFTNQLIDHLAKGTMQEFKEKYRKCDMLLIDDIQFIAGKTSTQEEFFHTFNALHEEHKQIILTSDRPPKEIQPLEERLLTRFEWGLLADIQPPDLELRVAIIKKKAEQVGITLPEDVLDFIAENLRSNVRQIEGAIKKLGAQAFLSGREINIELAQSCIIELMGGEEPVSVTVDKVFTAVKRHYGVTKEEILSENRKKEVAHARHITVYLIRQITEMSFPNLAKILHKKNHTTCINSFQQMEKKVDEDIAFGTEMNALMKEITAK